MLDSFSHIPMLDGEDVSFRSGAVAMPYSSEPLDPSSAAKEVVARERVPDQFDGDTIQELIRWSLARRQQASRDLAVRIAKTPSKALGF